MKKHYCGMRIEKIRNVGTMAVKQNHNERIGCEDKENIDLHKSLNNRVIFLNGWKENEKMHEVYKREYKRVSEEREKSGLKKIRCDHVKGLEILFWVDPDVFKEPEANAPKEEWEEYKRKTDKLEEETIKFFNNHFGNCPVEITFHKDEKTIHGHCLMIPATKDEKGNSTFSIDKWMGKRGKLINLQTDYAKEVGSQFGLVRGELKSKNKHKSIRQYYTELNRQEEEKQKQKYEQNKVALNKQYNDLISEYDKQKNNELKKLETELTDIKKLIKEKEAIKKQLHAENQKLKEQTKEKENKNKEVARQIKENNKKTNALKDELRELKQQQKDLNEKYDLLNKDKDEFNKKQNEFYTTLNEFTDYQKSEMNDLIETKEYIETEKAKAKEELEKVEIAKEYLKKDKDKVEKEAEMSLDEIIAKANEKKDVFSFDELEKKYYNLKHKFNVLQRLTDLFIDLIFNFIFKFINKNMKDDIMKKLSGNDDLDYYLKNRKDFTVYNDNKNNDFISVKNTIGNDER